MPYNIDLAKQLQDILISHKHITEVKMFGGLGYMLNGNMCVGIYRDFLIIRVGTEIVATLFEEEYVKPMDITGKPMKGWAMVSMDGLEDEENLLRYVELAIGFVNRLPAKK